MFHLFIHCFFFSSELDLCIFSIRFNKLVPLSVTLTFMQGQWQEEEKTGGDQLF